MEDVLILERSSGPRPLAQHAIRSRRVEVYKRYPYVLYCRLLPAVRHRQRVNTVW